MQSDITSYINPDNYLTTRQVLDILKVDRITIYRMLQDGRLKGVKIGQQWRFQRSEVERLLSGDIQPLDSAPVNPASQTSPDNSLPVHCLETIQTLFSSISQINTTLIDLQGNLLTHPSAPCRFCQLIMDSPLGRQACHETWKAVALHDGALKDSFTCHAGFQYIPRPVGEGGLPLGWIIAGPVYTHTPDAEQEAERLRQLAALYELSEYELQQALQSIKVIAPEQSLQTDHWVISAARAMESILQERSGFLQRLQQIASLTQLHP